MSALDSPVDLDVRPRVLDRSAAEELGRGLSRQDPMAAQQVLCEALSRAGLEAERGSDRLATLRALDGTARQICERLLDRYVEGDAQLRLHERRTYVSALRLSQSMSEAYESCLRRIGGSADAAEDTASAIVHLLMFRQIEFVLRMFRYKRRNANRWRALHAIYQAAAMKGLERHSVPLGSPADRATTAERQYVQILLLEAANNGQLSPREALWTHRWLPGWCAPLALRAGEGLSGITVAPSGFAIDLGGGEGPSRKTIAAGESVRYLGTEPLLKLIDGERTALRDRATGSTGIAPATRDAQRVLLEKLRLVFDPAPPRVERRGERVAVDSTVHVLAGLAHVVHALRTASMGAGRGTKAQPLDESTIQAFDGATRTMTLAAWNADSARAPVAETWQIRDRSDSGCRMRGKTADLNGVVPGSVLAMRDSDRSPWTIAVVRRLRRLMVDYVEVGAEFIGSRPRYVKLVPSSASGAEPRPIGALYLPPSEAYPAMPIRTLLLPAREYQPNRDVTLLSSNATHRLRFNDPIRHQMEFVWTSFTLLGKGTR